MFLTLLFPRRSLTGQDGAWITAEELQEIKTSPAVFLSKHELTVRGLTHLDGVLSCADFRTCPLLRKAIHLLKYKRIRQVSNVLGKLLADTLHRHSSDLASGFWSLNFSLTPLPLHWTRRFLRGFNQSMLLAKAVSGQTGIPVQDILKRQRKTRPQVGLSRTERLKNLKNAFAILGEIRVSQEVILIDDVMTTGTTLNQAAGALKSAGVARVFALTLAQER